MDVAANPNTNREQVLGILKLLESISATENINIAIVQVLGSKANCMAAIASLQVTSRERELALSVMFNTMASVTDEHCRDFIRTNIHHSILYLGLMEYYEEDLKVAKAATECLNLMLQLGAQVESDSQTGEPNPVAEYCLQHEALQNLEQSQRCTNKEFRDLINDIMDKYFTN